MIGSTGNGGVDAERKAGGQIQIIVWYSCDGLVVKVSALQLGGRTIEARTDMAGWLATS